MSAVTNPYDLTIASDPLLGAPLPGADGKLPVEVVFIESDVKDIGVLLAGIDPSKEVHILDASKDGLQQIADILQGRSGIDALHIVSHGAEGEASLGSLMLNSSTATSHASQLQAIGQSLDKGADILLYGCDTGAGASGASLVDQLAIQTGADVAASSNLTGAASLGGDWNLEVHSGNIEAQPLVDASLAAHYTDVLALTSVTVNFGTSGNFVSYGSYAAGAASDVTYKVSGNAGYVLKVDSVDAPAYSFGGSTGYVTVYGGSLITLSFTGGNVFTATSLDFTNFDGTNSETEVFKGYDASNTLVASTSATTAAAATSTVSLSGFTNITHLKITATTNGGAFWSTGEAVDNIAFSSIAAADTTPPTVTGVTSSTANGSYKAGDVIAIDVNFSETVNVTGTPQLTLETGTTDHAVNYSSGSGTSTLTFNYTVQAGDTSADLDYLSTTALALNGGTIKDLAGNAGTLTLASPGAANSLGANSAIVIDTTAPTVTDAHIGISGASGTGGAFKIGDTVTATWDNTGTGDNNTDISGATVDFSAFGGGSAVAATNSSGTWTATYTIVAGSVDGTNENVSVTATDNAGNATTTADTTNAALDNIAPAVTDAHISISGASGTSGAFKIGDTVTATWDNTASGDNNSDTISGATVDFSAFGGGSTVAATNSSGTWTATYTIVAGSVDGTNENVSVTATDDAGNTTTTADTSNATVDGIAPTVTDAHINISGASGTSGAFKIGDTVTATWDNTGTGDNNSDTISGATVDFSAFGGGSAVAASNSSGTWTATYTIVAGSIDGTNENVSVTATDNAGNTTTTADTTNAALDNIAPAVTDAHISISGASGTSGAFKIGDTVTATWDDTGTGDNNSDTISGATVDFSAFGGGTAVAATNSSGTWTATYTIVSGSIDGTNENVSVAATDDAGNTTTTADTSNATVDNIAPAVSDAHISISGASGTSGAFKIGDTVTATWDNTATGDNNSDTISGATVDFSAFGGGTAVAATNSSGTWTATYTIVSGSIDGVANSNVSVTAADDAGNTTTTADTTNATVDNVAPATTFSALAFSNDAGTSSTDFVTNSAAQTISATLSGALGAGDIVYGSLDNGSTWTDVTSKVSGTTLTWTGITIAASDTLQLKVTDAAGNDGTAASQAFVLDTTAPSITGVASSTADGDYHAGDVIAVTVTFAEAVSVTGTPLLTLETGTVDRAASYASGSGTNTLTFDYTVQAGDTSADLDYLSTSALALNGGAIIDTAGNNAVLTLASPGAAGSLGANANIQIDIDQLPTGSVVVSGTPTQGQVLTADTSGLADADGLGTFSYQWIRGSTNISLANSSTYTLTQADVGSTISVHVSYTDGYGHADSADSSATASVANVNDSPTGSVVITGTAAVGQVVTADTSTLADLDGLGTFSYQWLSGSTPIGTNSSTYTITSADISAPITVQVSYVDGFGTSESVVSSPVSPATTPTATNGNDVLVGGIGDDVLNGGKGADTMIGGAGNDTYFVDNGHDTVIEDTGEGTDTVNSTRSFTLPDNVENLVLAGTGHFGAVGNALDNHITGNSAANRITGGLGADTLTGGAGADKFVFTSVADSPAGVGTYDVITDFNPAEGDKLDLSRIDADPAQPGHQHFHFIGTAAFSSTDATGELRFDPVTHMLYGSVNADATAEFAVLLTGVTTLPASAIHM